MNVEGIKVTHAIPGRIRLKVSEVKENPTLAEEIQGQLSAVQGIRLVETNPLTGSVLVLYDAQAVTSLDSLRALLEPLSRFFPGIDLGELEAWFLSRNGSDSDPPVASQVSALFGTLNAGVREATGGIDLKVLLPLALCVLGIRGLLVLEKAVFPTWYDLLWFSFGTFVMLNRSAVEGGHKPSLPPP